jgi:hypothetical protein
MNLEVSSSVNYGTSGEPRILICVSSPFFDVTFLPHIVLLNSPHQSLAEQKISGTPVYAPSAIAAKGGKFRALPGEPGYVTVGLSHDTPRSLFGNYYTQPTAIDDPYSIIAQYKQAAINAKEAGFDGVEGLYLKQFPLICSSFFLISQCLSYLLKN